MPRIVVTDVGFHENGAMRVLIDLAARWHKRGAPTEFFVLQRIPDESPLLASWAQANMEVRYGAPAPARLRNALPAILARMLDSVRRADVVVSVSEIGNALLLGALAAKLLRKRFVAVIHAPVTKAAAQWISPRLHGATYAALRSAELCICVADGCIDDLLAIGVPRERIHVIRNGIDVARIAERGARPIEPPLPAEVGRPLVVSVGRLAAQKGFDLLLRAHAQLRAQGLLHHLAILGEGGERAALEQLAQELGVRDSVHLLGFCDNPHAVIARADLFCMPSRYEGFPLALIEALALGVPILSTNCVSGPSEILADGEFGDLVAPDSVEALAHGIARHLREPERLRNIAKRGPERARSFDPDKAAAQYLALFTQP